MKKIAFIAAMFVAAPALAANDADADRIAQQYVATAIKMKAATGKEAKNRDDYYKRTAGCTRQLFKENNYSSADVALMSEFIAFGEKGAKGVASDFMTRFQNNGKVVAFFRSMEGCHRS